MRFWLDRGVDSIRADAVFLMMEAEDKTLNEPRNPKAAGHPDEFFFTDHIHTASQPENELLVQEWTNLLKQYTTKEGNRRFILLETYEDGDKRSKYHKYDGGLPTNMDLIRILETLDISGENVKKVVDLEYASLPPEAWPTFQLGNHDRHRIANRHGPVYADAFNMLLLTLKGTPITYYGEEIGMVETELDHKDSQDPFGKFMPPDLWKLYSRDPERSPMQWDSSPHAGFTQAPKSWLPVHSEFNFRNVKSQMESEAPSSLKLYKTLATLRKQPAFQSGSLCYAFVTPEIFSYIREDPVTSTRYLVVLTFGKQPFTGTLAAAPVSATRGAVVACTCAVDASIMTTGQLLDLNDVTLSPGDGLVIKLEP